MLGDEGGVDHAGGRRRAPHVDGELVADRDVGRHERQRDAVAELGREVPARDDTHLDPGPQRMFALRSVLQPRSLDDSGAMCAGMIKAARAGVAPEALRPWIDNYLAYISTGQQRFADGTLARNRPLPNSLWLDDLYMSVPCLAQAGKLTGERKYYDDAAKQILQFADRMFVRDRKLFMHAWNQEMDYHPAFHWARANGWAIMAMAELPGPYDFQAYVVRARGITTNTCPMAPYRGVCRPAITLAMERLMDCAAARFRLDPVEIRRRNLVRSFPYRTATGLTYDEGSYRRALELAAERIDIAAFRERQRAARAEGRYLGIGFAVFNERTGYGTPADSNSCSFATPCGVHGAPELRLTFSGIGLLLMAIEDVRPNSPVSTGNHLRFAA